MKSKISVSEFRYRQRVGKRPGGRGNWAFMIRGQRVEFVDEMYSVAKKAAVKEATTQGSRGIRLIAPSHEELAAIAAGQLEEALAA